MVEDLILYNLGPSPNNIKARLALGYKGIEYKKVPVDPRDRSQVIEISGQPLTPVLTHKGHVILDSAGILRYIHSNFREGPSLFSEDYEVMKDIERWEAYARRDLAEPIRLVLGQFMNEGLDEDVFAQANRMLHQRTACIEEQLEQASWLVGNELTAADISAAPYVYYGMVSEEDTEGNPVADFFHKHLDLGEGREKTREWASLVMAYDK